MSPGVFGRVFSSTLNIVFKRFLISLIKIFFIYLIAFLFVYLPTLWNWIMVMGKNNERSRKQREVRAKLVDENDPSSPYRAVGVVKQLRNQPSPQIKTLADIPDYCVERFADRETMGVREVLDVLDEEQPNGKIFKKFVLGDYKFTTYRQNHERIVNIARGLFSIGARPNDRILIFAETRPEWLLTALAAFRHGITVVTLYSTLGEEAIKHGVVESQVSIIITSQDLLSKLEKTLDQTTNVRHVVYFPSIVKQNATKASAVGQIQFHPIEQLEEQGRKQRIDENLLEIRPKSSDLAVIMYTSGSTGVPKGVLIKHENIVAAMTGEHERIFPMIDAENDVYIAYLPLAHILELSCEIVIYYLGIKCGYSSPQTLTDQSTAIKQGQKGDLQVLRPHIMSCVPTILDRIHKAVNEKIAKTSFFRRQLFKLSYKIKVKRLEEGLTSPNLDRLVFRQLNGLVLGGRVKTMLCGGAVLSEDTQRFVQAALCVTLFQGYGLTETCAAGTIADQFDINVGRAGYPLVSCEIRLKDWDEGKYKNTDKPNPRGEILIGGKVVASGYFAEAAKENINFVEIDGTRYFCTGDIGEIFPDGTVKIIDRKKDLVKLRGGEYVSLTKVEMAVSKLPFIENSCLYASSSAEYTVILICPNLKRMSDYAERNFSTSDWQSIINEQKFIDQVLKDIQEACRKGGIERFETPQKVYISSESWTPETGLVTDALKLKRKAIEQKYRDIIEDLYEDRPRPSTQNKARANRVVPAPTNDKHDQNNESKKKLH